MGRIIQFYRYMSKRWGEALCFTVGGIEVYGVTIDSYGLHNTQDLTIAGMLFAVALILRAQRIWRERP